MATPNTLNRLIRDKTAYQWLNEQLKLHGTITRVAEENGVSRAAIYKLIESEGFEIVQRVYKKLKTDA